MTEPKLILSSALASLHLHLAELYSSLGVASSEARAWRLTQEIKETTTLTRQLENLL
jgi:hypothetical protein